MPPLIAGSTLLDPGPCWSLYFLSEKLWRGWDKWCPVARSELSKRTSNVLKKTPGQVRDCQHRALIWHSAIMIWSREVKREAESSHCFPPTLHTSHFQTWTLLYIPDHFIIIDHVWGHRAKARGWRVKKKKAPLRLDCSPPQPPATQEKSLELTRGSLKVLQTLATRHCGGAGLGWECRLPPETLTQ